MQPQTVVAAGPILLIVSLVAIGIALGVTRGARAVLVYVGVLLALFAAVPGVVVVDEPREHRYPLATEAAGRDEIFVGRVRADASLPDLKRLEEEELILLAEQQRWRDSLAEKEFVTALPPSLTPAQDAAWERLRKAIMGARSTPLSRGEKMAPEEKPGDANDVFEASPQIHYAFLLSIRGAAVAAQFSPPAIIGPPAGGCQLCHPVAGRLTHSTPRNIGLLQPLAHALPQPHLQKTDAKCERHHH